MVDITETTVGSRTSSVFKEDIKLITVHDGNRGEPGRKGNEGDPGDPGDSIQVLGEWNLGTVYCPLDAVSWRSSVVDHVNSLYVQRSDAPCQPSTLPPNEDPGRWDEIGAVDWDSAFGGIWHVTQIDHGFTKIGQPVAYSFQADRYILADSRQLDELGICVVREVVDKDRVILQSSGEVPNIDPEVIYPFGSDWEPGRVYYVSIARGMVSLEKPSDPNYYSNPILMATDVWEPGGGLPSQGRNGVALPWTPVGGPGSQQSIVVGHSKFYFTGVVGETEISGADDRGSVLDYIVGDNTDVFKNGLNLRSEVDFTATDGSSITFTSPLASGDLIEVWTPSQPLEILVPSTVAKLDNIEAGFNGSQTIFPLTYGGQPVAVQSAVNTNICLDGGVQEALVDYTLTGTTESSIEFLAAPEAGTRFWGTILLPVDDGEGDVSVSTLSLQDGDMIQWDATERVWRTVQPQTSLRWEYPNPAAVDGEVFSLFSVPDATSFEFCMTWSEESGRVRHAFVRGVTGAGDSVLRTRSPSNMGRFWSFAINHDEATGYRVEMVAETTAGASGTGSIAVTASRGISPMTVSLSPVSDP